LFSVGATAQLHRASPLLPRRSKAGEAAHPAAMLAMAENAGSASLEPAC